MDTVSENITFFAIGMYIFAIEITMSNPFHYEVIVSISFSFISSITILSRNMLSRIKNKYSNYKDVTVENFLKLPLNLKLKCSNPLE